MPMESKRASVVIFICFDAKNPGAFRVQDFLLDELFNPLSCLKRRIHLNERIRPQKSLGQVIVHVFSNPIIFDIDETLDIIGIILYQPVSQSKHIHGRTSSWGETKKHYVIMR